MNISWKDFALWPATHIVNAILMLFGLDLHNVPSEWRVIIVGVVAFMFWAHIAKLIIGVIQRRIFGHYGNGG